MKPAPHSARSTTGWRSSLATIPGILVAFLAKFACPACWPAYAGILASVGLGFLLDERYLLPLTASFLALAVGALAFRASRRRGYGPFGLGLQAAGIVLLGRFAVRVETATYAGIGLLVTASVWNAWPRRKNNAASCPECIQHGPATDSTDAR